MSADRSLRRRIPGDPWAYAAMGLVAMGLLVFFVLPGLVIHASDFRNAKDRVSAENAVRTVGVQLLGGFVLVVGVYFTARTLRLNSEGQITDRFSTAVGHLGETELATRLGGIYALERVMKDSRADQGPILEILCAFVRARAAGTRSEHGYPPLEVSAALRVIGRRNTDRDPPELTLNLSTTNLSSVSLRDGNYAKTNFWQTDLRSAFLSNTMIQGAYLRSADLRNATLRDTDLRNANLRQANLEGTEIERVQFEGAKYDRQTRWPDDRAPTGTTPAED